MLACLKQVEEELETPIDLNSASAETLSSLPGVADVIAKRIEEGAPYSSVNDLTRVDGIGEHKLAAIRRHVTV
jgi:competence protein ComEA